MNRRYAGGRIVLSPLQVGTEAKSKYQEWLNDPAFTHFMGKHDRVYSGVAVDKWVEERANNEKGKYFSVFDSYSEEMIGYCGIWESDRANAIFSVCIGEKSYQGRGYGEDLVKAMMQFSFDEMGVHRCELCVVADNIRAVKCYQKCGFTECGHEHEVVFYGGRWHDMLIMECLEENYVRG